ncbi:TonB-dependent receptor [Sphingobacterium bambusae]|uniref:TonB-dependent receptor n=1 Tax=Sphingobacterium bambusae TaxID=662858 RepID=A0ABW6BH93_9SPHI|nr:TonB-dependent receptor [Sphingobacterium bambusae]WPL49397.1 TonB-dependent receptor [Sphingobacterium bambusae]
MKILLLPLFLVPFLVLGQGSFAVRGRILSLSGLPLGAVRVTLPTVGKAVDTDGAGLFEIKDVSAGTYAMNLQAAGYRSMQSTIVVDRDLELSLTLQDTSKAIKEVIVTGKGKAVQLSELPMNIQSLDVQKVADLALGVEEVLRTSTGVVVRQSGGLGSELSINLNGLTGEAVRIYYDGIPMQVYGNAMQVNNIPVDALQRIDVYKGVMPVDVGTDALGGGINLVPLEPTKSQLRASYSIGSFNTHRLTVNGNKNWNDKTSLSVSSFYNYSDNDYTMRNIPNSVEIFDEQGEFLGLRRERINAKRFHSQHQSSFIEAALNLKNRSWTDKFVFSLSHSYRFNEIQHGRFIDGTAVGEATTNVSGFTQRIDYRKKFMDGKFDVRYFGILSNAFSKVNDSTKFAYNWTGERLRTTNVGGAEIFSYPTARDAHDVGTSHRFIANLHLTRTTTAKISDFYSYTRIKGEDPYGIRPPIAGVPTDPNTIPSKVRRNIFGAELEQRLLAERMTLIGFYKRYNFAGEAIDLLAQTATTLPLRNISDAQNGYGVAMKYDILRSLFVRASYERAVRIPTEAEIFGDFLVILPNYNLKPETSNNINFGISYSDKLSEEVHLSLKVDGFLRDQKNLIRLQQVGLENARNVNQAAVDGKGIEFSSRLTLFGNLDFAANLTYQSNKIAQVGDDYSDASIGRQIPNIPNLFYNVGLEYTLKNIFRSPNNLHVYWTYFFTDRFSINEVASLNTASPEYIIPVQNLHNAGVTYAIPDRGLSLSFNVQNALNAEIFDNFRVPRPGFNAAFKINYTLFK